MAEVHITDHIHEVLDAFNKQKITALNAVGMQAVNHAKRNIVRQKAVDTGNLLNSITHAVDSSDDSVYIGTNVEYAPFVELGTYKMPARPYLKPAATEHASEYQRIFEAALKD